VQTFNGQIEGPFTLADDLELRGMITGDAKVPAGKELVLLGMVTGDLTVEEGGTAIVRGTVGGSIVNGGRVEISGRVVGSLQNVDRGHSDVHPQSDVRES
jgi:cytoskeletal protein CcmA (bactofilin family)